MRRFRVARVAVTLVAAIVLAGLVAVAQAPAATIADCQAQLAQLRSDTVAAEAAFTNVKDFNSVLGKLDAAATKLDQNKLADASQKLSDFQSLLTGLASAPKPKLDAAVAEQLVAEAQGVIDCINAIGP